MEKTVFCLAQFCGPCRFGKGGKACKAEAQIPDSMTPRIWLLMVLLSRRMILLFHSGGESKNIMPAKPRSLMFLFVFSFPFMFSTSLAQAPPPYLISGEVLDEFGQPAAGVRVCAFPDTSEPKRGIICSQRSDDKGKFRIRLTMGGAYGLYYERPDGYMSQNRLFYRHTPARIPQVKLTADAPQATASVPLNPKSGAVAGKAIDAKTNLPVEDLLITLCKVDRPEVCVTTNSKTTTGQFRVFGSLTPFTMKISADGYEDWLGANGRGEPIQLATGASMEVAVSLTRRKEFAGQAIHEAEKKAGLHLPAPAQLAPEANAVFKHFPRATKLEWKPVEGAVSYSVEIDICHNMDESKEDCASPQTYDSMRIERTRGLTGTSYEFNFGGANPGRWRVWAVGKEGQAGFKSPWRKFTYLR
jgi:hypothetical protein